MALEPDIIDRISLDFPESERSTALKLLEASGKSGRVARCIIMASGGDLEKLRSFIALAIEDFRDVIMAGEYDPLRSHIRDLRASFLVDAPEKFWIGSVAAALQARGYVLSSLESRKATMEPFEYAEDEGQGVAKFDGEWGPITIEKNARCWTLHGEPETLELHGLDRPFDNETSFTEAVSCYLLSKKR